MTTLTRDEMITRLVARDIAWIEEDLLRGDIEFLCDIMDGAYWTQWCYMSDEQVAREFQELDEEHELSKGTRYEELLEQLKDSIWSTLQERTS